MNHVTNHVDEVCLVLAIQTVLHQKRYQLHLFTDMAFIQDMIDEISIREKQFQKMTDAVVKDMESRK